jgi:hypothetical protein
MVEAASASSSAERIAADQEHANQDEKFKSVAAAGQGVRATSSVRGQDWRSNVLAIGMTDRND